MRIRYYVCGLGYDMNGNITDYERCFGNFDTYVEAYEQFVKMQCADREMLFENAVGVYQLLLQLEECTGDDFEITCIDAKNKWWITNPNFKEEI